MVKKLYFILRRDGKRFVGGEGRVQWRADPAEFLQWEEARVAQRVATDLRQAGHACDVELLEVDG